MMDEIYRVLKPMGTCWINLGDTYSGSGDGQGDKNAETRMNGLCYENQNNSNVKSGKTDIKNKSLILIPHRFAIGCIERNWILRNDCIWAKRNGMPESVTDRFSKKHEYFFFMVKSKKYFFDLDAIRDKNITESNFRDRANENYGIELSLGKGEREWNNDKGKNPGSVSDFWDIPTKPSSSKHYASYNDSLLVKPVLAGCPEGGIIYDPFMGTGSTAEVALRSNRLFIGSEPSGEYCKIANSRLQPFLLQTSLF